MDDDGEGAAFDDDLAFDANPAGPSSAARTQALAASANPAGPTTLQSVPARIGRPVQGGKMPSICALRVYRWRLDRGLQR